MVPDLNTEGETNAWELPTQGGDALQVSTTATYSRMPDYVRRGLDIFGSQRAHIRAAGAPGANTFQIASLGGGHVEEMPPIWQLLIGSMAEAAGGATLIISERGPITVSTMPAVTPEAALNANNMQWMVTGSENTVDVFRAEVELFGVRPGFMNDLLAELEHRLDLISIQRGLTQRALKEDKEKGLIVDGKSDVNRDRLLPELRAISLLTRKINYFLYLESLFLFVLITLDQSHYDLLLAYVRHSPRPSAP